jgi:hypothetical protein
MPSESKSFRLRQHGNDDLFRCFGGFVAKTTETNRFFQPAGGKK